MNFAPASRGLLLLPGLAAALSPACVRSAPLPVVSMLEPPTPVSETGTWAWDYKPDDFRADALLDLRFLNEKAAGETGFVRLSADGNSFVRGDGKPIRFFAVVSDLYGKPNEVAKHARFLAKHGVNMVRIHASISPKKKGASLTDVDQEEIDKIWRAVAAFKKEGIYVTLSPFWANAGHSGAQASWGLDGYGDGQDIWGLIFFNPKLQEAYKGWVRALYEPKNPYTGIPLAKDPAVGIIQVQNEDSLLFWTTQAIKAPQLRILAKAFGDWSIKKYGSLDKAKSAWGGASADGDEFEQGQAGILPTWQLVAADAGPLEARVQDQTQFLGETQRKFYADMVAHYRSLGCKQLTNASNWITADPIKLNDLERWTYLATDVLAVNKYTGGAHLGENNGWRIDPGHKFTSASNLKDWRSLPTNLKQVQGHPMIVTESTWVAPEPYQAEGPILIAAYQSLTGVDGYYWFAMGATEYETEMYMTWANLPGGQHPMQKWTASTPQHAGGFPAAALLYRLGYVKEAAPVVQEVRNVADLWARKSPIIAEDKSFDPNRAGTAKGASDITRGVDPLAFLVGPVTTRFDGAGQQTTVADLSKYLSTEKQTVTSATGEVRLNYGKGIAIVNAPKAQAAVGFLSDAGKIALSDVSIESGNPYASVAVVALDDLPLRVSKKILVQVGTEVRPTGWETKPATFKSEDGKQDLTGYEIVNTGKLPWRIQNTQVTLTIANPTLTRATLLDSAGYAVKTLSLGSVTGANGKKSVLLKLPANTMYVVLQ